MILAAAAVVVVTTVAVAIAWHRPARPFVPSAVSERWLLDHVYLHGKSGDF